MLENSPLDTLAFNYLSFDFFNHLWTWLAVIFWRIPTPKPELLPPSHDTSSDKPHLGLEVLEPRHDYACPARVPSNSVVEDDDGVTKGKMKFTLYYYDHEDEDDIDRECKESVETLKKITEELWEEKEGRLGWWESWENLLRTRTGENEGGWYTCQDLTVINGNVVRFWDEEFEFASFANGGIK